MKQSIRINVINLTLLVLGIVGNQCTAQQKKPEIYVDPVKAGPDFALQGEYEGETTAQEKLGAQVIAEGDGKFVVALLKGGLPGAGWDRKTRVLATAARAEDKATITGAWSGDIAGGKVTGQTADGASFTLQRRLRESPTLGARPPKEAIVLFDGSSGDDWTLNRTRRGPFKGMLVEDGSAKLLPMGSTTKQTFQEFRLHLEFRIPFVPAARGQNRGNSGVYLQGRYEVQVLDSFGLPPGGGECGAIYGVHVPAQNMCFPPLSWQSYDVEFRAARFDDQGQKTAPAQISVIHNGVKVHDNVSVRGPTGQAILKDDDAPGPIDLQGTWGEHIHYRNIWLVPTSRNK